MKDVAEQVAAVAVDVTNFIAACEASSQAKKTATLLKTLNVNALITGEVGVGKKSLASFILPDAFLIDASNFDELLLSLENSENIIITNLEKSPNFERLMQAIKENNVRVVATAKESFSHKITDDLFSVKFNVPPLRERMEDVEELLKLFIADAMALFGTNNNFDVSNFKPDLSQNALSLKRQVMMNYLLQDVKDIELMDIIEQYLYDKLGSNSDYRTLMYLYEVPLIKAGLHKFKSQVQLAEKLGLNRNTLRKKIAEHKKYIGNKI